MLRANSAIFLAVAASCAVAACQKPPASPAPFRARPDSVKPGQLLGPFTGRVVDAASGDPVAGALVYATWSLRSGYGLSQAAGYREQVVSTDATGHYNIDKLRGLDTGNAPRVSSFHLVIYKRGYVAYRSDRRFSDLGPRRDFAQRQNEVVLERWRGDFSHVRHLRYVGGGPAIAALTAWEAEEAAAELSGQRGVAGPRMATDIVPQDPTGAVVAAQLLTEKQITDITGFKGGFETGPLGDQPDTAAYTSQHFRALGQGEIFDIALRVWKLDAGEAQKQYAELADALPAVDKRDEIADRSLRAIEGEIFGVSYLDAQRGIVVLLTCGKGQCTKQEQAVELARTTYDAIKRLAPAGAGQTSGAGQ